MHQTFIGALQELSLEEKCIDLFKDQLRLVYEEVNEERDKMNGEYQRQLKQFDEKIERLEERFINEEVKADLFEKFALKLKFERKEIEDKLKECPITGSNLEYYISRSVELTTELATMWNSSDFTHKKKLQKLIFPEGILYNKKNDESRTTKINLSFF